MIGDARLDALAVPDDAKLAVTRYLRYCELGAVSPDYPYFTYTQSATDKVWADLMHYRHTADMIKAGIPRVAALSGDDRLKALAWLLGYTAHVALDLSLHPVVEEKVGPYYGNENDHRICEMHQDVHIFARMNLGELSAASYLSQGVAKCDQDGMGPIFEVWNGMFQDTYPKNYAQKKPDISSWHSGYSTILGAGLGVSSYPTLARAARVVAGAQYVFPSLATVDPTYIKNLKTPAGPKDYDEIFDAGVDNVARWWEAVANAVYGDRSKVGQLVNGDLDNGRMEGGFTFWAPVPV